MRKLTIDLSTTVHQSLGPFDSFGDVGRIGENAEGYIR